MFNLELCQLFALLLFHLTDKFNLPVVFFFLDFLTLANFEIPFTNESLAFCFGFPHRSISFFLRFWVFHFQLFQVILMIDQLGLRVQKLFRKIRNLNFYLTILIFELVTDKFSLFSHWKQIVIIAWCNEFVNAFRMGLNLENLFCVWKGVLAVSNGSTSFFWVCAVEKCLVTVQKGYLWDIAVSVNFHRGWNVILGELVPIWFSLFVFLGFRGDFYFINALIFIVYRRGEISAGVDCSFIDQSLLFIFAYKYWRNCLHT